MKQSIRFVLAVAIIITTNVAPVKAKPTNDAELDALLSQSHTPRWIMNNPFPALGNPVGIAGNYSNEFAIVYSNGAVFRFNESVVGAPPSNFAQFGTGLTATAISYIPSGQGFNGNIAVAEADGFSTYGLSGGHIDDFGITTPYNIQDIKIDIGKVYVATSGNLGIRNSDGTIDETGFGSGSSDNIFPVNLVSGLTDRIFTGSNTEFKLDSLGRAMNSTYLATDLTSKQGYGITENTLLVIRGDGSIRCYDNPFAGIMNIPEPGNPFAYLQSNYTPRLVMANPHPEWGIITGAEGVDNGTKVAILWENAAVEFYNSDMTVHLGRIQFAGWVCSHQITSVRGIAQVPGSNQNELVLGEPSQLPMMYTYLKLTPYGDGGNGYFDCVYGLFLYDADPITDLAWDNKHQRLLIVTPDMIGIRGDDLRLTNIYPGSSQGVEYISLPADTQDMLQRGNLFNKINADGSLDTSSSFTTDLGGGESITGIAYTRTSAIIVTSQNIYIYDKLAFQDSMDYRGNMQIPIYCDFDNSGTVDFKDLTKLLEHWLEASTYDLNDDGIINMQDLAIFSNHWLITNQM